MSQCDLPKNSDCADLLSFLKIAMSFNVILIDCGAAMKVFRISLPFVIFLCFSIIDSN